MKIESFEQLDVWKESHAMVLDVYRTTKLHPSEEKFGLISQMRRAAVSIPANIAEGFKRRGLKDKSHFYNIAQGSLEELRYYFIVCRDLVTRSNTKICRTRRTTSAACLRGSSARSNGRSRWRHEQ